MVMSPAWAGSLSASTPVQVSDDSPFDVGCGMASVGGTVFLDSEVEPYVDVNPTNTQNMIAIWQQDRWSDGGARGNVAGVTFDGGETWEKVTFPNVTTCTGGEFDRASDPWISFGPDGTAYAMHLVFDAAPPPTGPAASARPGRSPPGCTTRVG